jgi:ribosomal protein S18 acetylase RimI-like enzyme
MLSERASRTLVSVEVRARRATAADAAIIETLYRGLAAEMDALRPIWSAADGLAEPVAETIAVFLEDGPWSGYVGEIDGVPVGFLLVCDESLLPRGGGRTIAAARFIYTQPEARQVGVGEAMMDSWMEDAGSRGVALFDAYVSPGHREAKNFFESHGFVARSIVMHRSGS